MQGSQYVSQNKNVVLIQQLINTSLLGINGNTELRTIRKKYPALFCSRELYNETPGGQTWQKKIILEKPQIKLSTGVATFGKVHKSRRNTR